MKCKKCRKQIPDDSKFCNHCGAKQENQKMYRRSDGLYEKIITVNGKRKAFRGKTEKEVNQKILNYNKDLEKGPLFETVADEWEKESCNGFAYNTYKGYKSKIARAKEQFEGVYIKTINTPDVEQYIKKFPRTWAYKTQKHYLSVLSLIFDFSIRKDYIKYNPAEKAKLPTGLKRTHRRAPTEEEINIIKKSVNKNLGIFALFILYTGLRRGEACALTWNDIDFKNRTISVNKSICWTPNKPVIKEPKTSSGVRSEPLLDVLIKPLKKLKRSSKTDIVFGDEEGNIYTSTKIQRAWEKYQKETGLTELTPHCLRHGYATICKAAGIDNKEAQYLLGHANYSTTADIYTHLQQNHIQTALEKLNTITENTQQQG